jgi:acyl-CoA synthetase (AMP-forming)/AMP-acid ligase II
MTVFNHPEGRNRLLNHIVDDIAQNEPQKLFAEIPLSPTSFDQGFRKVTYLDLSNAINGVAAFLERSIGGGQNFPTLVYFGPPDLRYVVLLLAAVKAGYKVRTTAITLRIVLT